ncbi:Athe_2463 domain-containing protein [Sporosalibacterium faouarense]|uniref:Athe_2463 domain-containing protein n=1 Tax=Sporosalibacterium faouarense TaxID=516123 RepID=UPI00192BBF3F|nr:hypothetical protein [Sporosalibacterium faouarense]
MNKSNRALTILLMITMLVQVIYFPPKIVNGEEYSYGDPLVYEGISYLISFDSIKDELPMGITETNANGLKLNTEIWVDHHKAVYGWFDIDRSSGMESPKYQDINSGVNDKKTTTLNPKGAYFRDDEGNPVEWRWWGFSFDGNPYINFFFPPDSTSGRPNENKKWYYNVWDVKDEDKISVFNTGAIFKGNVYAKKWINDSIDWEIKNGIFALNNESVPKEHFDGMEKYRYINVLSPPTTEYSGDGIMRHRDSSGKVWYQTFSINPIKEKEEPDKISNIEIKEKNNLLLSELMGAITIEVTVTAKLEDEFCFDNISLEEKYTGPKYDEYERSVYYHRKNIEEWDITLIDKNHSKMVNEVEDMSTGNMVKKKFEIVYTREELESNSSLDFEANTFISYDNGFVGSPVKATNNATVTVEEGNGFKSLFTINNDITVSEDAPLVPSKINYMNASVGDIASYNIEIVNETTKEMTSVSGSTVDNDSVNQAFFDMANPYIENYYNYVDEENGNDHYFTVRQTVESPRGRQDIYEETVKISVDSYIPIVVPPDVSLPKRAFDIVEYKPRDNTDMTDVVDKKVFVDGQAVDYNEFFSGSYTFGASDKDKIVQVKILYTSVDDVTSKFISYVRVLSTKPKVQFKLDGYFKENRKLTLDNTSDNANDPYLISNYPISYSWSYGAIGDSNDSDRRMKDISVLYKELLYKEPGTYTITLEGSNSLGRVADPYVLEFSIQEDTTPAIIMNLWNNVLARDEVLNMSYEAVSIEGDIISTNRLEIWYDSGNDGTFDQLINTFEDPTLFKDYSPPKLGSYKMVSYVEEDFGQETIPEFITEDDKVSETKERLFYVQNLRPMTQLYVDIPQDFPEVDIYFMNDKNLARNTNDNIRNERIDYENELRKNNILPKIEVWDMHTYMYSKTAYSSRSTGTRYPSSSKSYSSGGYSGTLSRYKVVDNGENVDFGKYVTKTDSKTATGTKRTTSWSKYDADGKMTSSSGSSSTSSISYSSGGYTGTLHKNGYSFDGESKTTYSDGSYKITRRYTGYYSGTVTKTYQVWESDWRWVSDYRGYYSGTVRKYVTQPYSNPFRTLSDKYIVYVSDDYINQMSNLTMVREKSDAKLILVGSEAIKNQVEYDYFIPISNDIGDFMPQIMNIVTTANPYELGYKIIKGEAFTINYADIDEEGDPIIERKFQYIHDENYYDNSEGIASVAYSIFDETQYSNTEITSFNKVGKYEVYRRIKDEPIDIPSMGLYSNEPKLTIYVHRKPIANATLDWDYDNSTSTYKTTWVDKSYDLDHEFSRPDKGIIERKIMYRRNSGEWKYKIPDNLIPGNYELRYYVKDLEGVWSEPYSMDFTLASAPPIQFSASARALDNNFSLASIPASEYLELYNIWTRYPYSLKLQTALYDGGTRVSPIKTINYYTGTKNDNDIDWDNIDYEVPATLSDKSYTLKLTAVDANNSSKEKELNYNVTLSTPVDLLVTYMPEEYITEEENIMEVETSKYVEEVEVTLFKGTPYEVTEYMNLEDSQTKKTWNHSYIPSSSIPEGNYMASVTATTFNGNTESIDMNFKLENVKLFDFKVIKVTDWDFESIWKNTGLEIGVGNLAIDETDHPEGKLMKRGYAFYFSVSSKGLDGPNDTIRIRPKFYDMNTGNELDMYYATHKDAYVLATSDYGDRDENDNIRIFYTGDLNDDELLGYHNEIFLPKSLRTINGQEQTWIGRYGIPSTAIFVEKGKEPWIEENRILNPVKVNFDIDAFKNGAKKLDYIDSGQWEKERRDNNGLIMDLIKYNKYSPGDVIVIDPSLSIDDDYEVTPIW